MTTGELRRAVLALVQLGIAARVVAIFFHPALHPDEFFQYVEPAWWHLHGYGWPAWEWAVGLRSWILPAYHGAWMVLLEWIGLGKPAQIHSFLQVHWAVVGALVVPAAADAGQRMAARDPRAVDAAQATGAADGWEGGLLAALASAFLPILVYYGPHTLSEIPSMLFFAWGYAYWVRARSGDPGTETRALAAGALLSAGACFRIANGPLAVLPVLDFAARKAWRPLGACLLGALAPLALFAGVDWATWGRPLHSFVEYVKFNVQSAGDRFGSAPAYEYVAEMRDEIGWPGLACLAIPLALEARAVWTWALGGLMLLAVLSAEAHKENRFILCVWLFLAVAWGAALGRVVARERAWIRARARRWLAVTAVLIVLGEGALGLSKLPRAINEGRWPIYRAQAWVGQRPDSTGVLVDGYFAGSGGWSMLGRNVPLESFSTSLLGNPLFNYFLLRRGSHEEEECEQLGARRVWAERGPEDVYVVLQR